MLKRLHPLLQGGIFPLSLILGLSGYHLAVQAGWPPLLIQMGIFAATLMLVILLEIVLPKVALWRKGTGDWRVDAPSFAVLMGGVDPFVKIVSPPLVATLVPMLADIGLRGVWPEGWHFFAQLALAAVIAEFGQYWTHRLAHRPNWLWRCHALHHSARRIYWLNGFRVHPFNMIWHHFAGVFILMLLGAGIDVIVGYGALTAMVSLFQHGNIDLTFGPLNYIFSTAELHRWHHSERPEEANRNFGGVLILWDLVFGTFHHRPGAMPQALGLFPGSVYPEQRLDKQLVAPFFWPAQPPMSEEIPAVPDTKPS